MLCTKDYKFSKLCPAFDASIIEFITVYCMLSALMQLFKAYIASYQLSSKSSVSFPSFTARDEISSLCLCAVIHQLSKQSFHVNDTFDGFAVVNVAFMLHLFKVFSGHYISVLFVVSRSVNLTLCSTLRNSLYFSIVCCC